MIYLYYHFNRKTRFHIKYFIKIGSNIIIKKRSDRFVCWLRSIIKNIFIIENLKNMNVENNHDLYYQSTYSGSELCEALNEIFGLELNREYYQPKVIRKK